MACRFPAWSARLLSACMLAFAAACLLITAQPQEACAYAYVKTDAGAIFNRTWIAATSTGSLELIGSDAHGTYAGAPSFDGASMYVESYAFAVWGDAGGQDDLVWYGAWGGSWTRGGARMGHGNANIGQQSAANGTGWGCLATYGYGWSGAVLSKHGGLDALVHCHTYISDSWYGLNKYGEAEFWPRVKIQYDKGNTTASVSGLPSAHYKYMGAAANVSSAKPTRKGYTFEGWSLAKTGVVQVAGGQRIGCPDWNQRVPMSVPHSWSSGPTSFYRDVNAGIASPTGTNVVTLYAVWKPVTYRVTYQGNGATGGSTATSSHVFDAAKTLTANGFSRSYRLTCDAQGGSANTRTLACAWAFVGWNASAAGTGASYADEASVLNLRSVAGTVALHAQWKAGGVILPDPGAKAGCVFKGWYTAVSGGVLVGQVDEVISIDRDVTCYARWEQLAEVGYYVDGLSEPVFVERVPVGTAYAVNAEAVSKGAKAGCAGFDGWYVDAACAQLYEDGAPVLAEGLHLHGRNEVRLVYDLTDQTRALLAERACFVDEELSVSVTGDDDLLPAAQIFHYGDRVSFACGPSLWYEQHGSIREASCEPGAYAAAAGDGPLTTGARLTCNTTAYLAWRTPVYDGIEIS